MKHLLLALVFSSTFIACNDAREEISVADQSTAVIAEPGALTSIQWIDSTKDLGRINEGQKVQISFRFKNSGNKPLVIQSVRPGCGCTVADYPKEPIAPGKEAAITGSFDSQGREGLQHKEIYVSANTSGSSEHKVSFDVEVIKKN